MSCIGAFGSNEVSKLYTDSLSVYSISVLRIGNTTPFFAEYAIPDTAPYKLNFSYLSMRLFVKVLVKI